MIMDETTKDKPELLPPRRTLAAPGTTAELIQIAAQWEEHWEPYGAFLAAYEVLDPLACPMFGEAISSQALDTARAATITVRDSYADELGKFSAKVRVALMIAVTRIANSKTEPAAYQFSQAWLMTVARAHPLLLAEAVAESWSGLEVADLPEEISPEHFDVPHIHTLLNAAGSSWCWAIVHDCMGRDVRTSFLPPVLRGARIRRD
jgi:hypothetical protein